MKKIVVLVLLCVCVGAFAEENVSPTAGSFGLSARIAVLNDFLAGEEWDLFKNPGTGIGLRYHAFDRLLLEMILSGGYLFEENETDPDYNYITLGLGCGVYYWMPSTGNLSKYIGLQVLANGYGAFGEPSTFYHIIAAAQFGMQYNFNKNLAIFGNFGIGGGNASHGLSGGGQDDRYYIHFMPPQVGIVFYL